MAQSELEFATLYLNLLDSPIVIPSTHRLDLNSISTFVKLPELPVTYHNDQTNDNKEETIDATFKSIKQPKFNVTLQVSLQQSIHSVKETLIKEVDELKGYSASQIKLLIKGKVIQDANLLKNLGDESLVFTVMLSGTAAPAAAVPVVAETEADKAIAGDNTDTKDEGLPWDAIALLLKEKGVKDVDGVVDRLQRGWDLTDL